MSGVTERDYPSCVECGCVRAYSPHPHPAATKPRRKFLRAITDGSGWRVTTTPGEPRLICPRHHDEHGALDLAVA